MAEALLTVENLTKSYGDKLLFDNISFGINAGQKTALIARNGYGKSTLLNILTGKTLQDEGKVTFSGDVKMAYLPQQPEVLPRQTLRSFVYSVERPEHEDEWTFEQRIEEILSRLRLDSKLDQPMETLSGGEQKKAALSRILVDHTNLLLLDEPTNHLDIVSIQWLENYLGSYSGAVVLVSHDRTFLDNITRRTIEITAGRIYDYKCPYSEYVVQMQERRASQMAQLTNQQRQVAQIEAFIERFRYKATKSKQVQSRIKMLERMETIKVDEVSTESIHFQFPPAPHSGKIVVEAQHLGKAYGDNQVFDGVDFMLTSGRKVAFVGRNGEGKSTMAKIIVGDINDYTGTFRLGTGVALGYYAQNQAAMLNLDKTVFETIDDIAQGDIRPKIRNILGSFLFSDDDIDKKVKVLSGGEKARLALAKLLLTPSNLLVLDEPTNHLDMNSKDILKNALLQYTGTLIVVSHDRDFLSGLTDELYEFRDGAVHEFKGDIMEFLEAQNAQTAAVAQSAPSTQKTSSAGKAAYEQSRERERERRKLQNAVKQKEQEIEALEAEIAAKDTILATGEAQPPDFYKAYQSLKDQLEQKMNEWEEAVIAAEE